MRPPSGETMAYGRSVASQRMAVTARTSFVPAPYTTTSCPFVVHSLTRPSGVTTWLGMLRRSSHESVVKRDGEVSSAFAFGGAQRQTELLRAEGVEFADETHVDMARYCVPFLPIIG